MDNQHVYTQCHALHLDALAEGMGLRPELGLFQPLGSLIEAP